jgi:hypothetical protein
MSTALLLGFFCLVVAGTAVTMFIRGFNKGRALTEAGPEADEADERLITAADILAVRAAFDQMLVRKGLLTGDQLDLIRHGTKSCAVVTGMRTTGESREDYREVELDVMVRKPGGGQFPAHQRTLIPASSLARVSPCSIIDTFYRCGDESAVAVCVPPS